MYALANKCYTRYMTDVKPKDQPAPPIEPHEDGSVTQGDETYGESTSE